MSWGDSYVWAQMRSVWGQAKELLRHCGTLLASQRGAGWETDTGDQ